ncbi:lipopolysaccharide-induced tumor necrosis factor-alpha factor homolog [Austrofundulus limnaeus]|uniref:Lipopolysaccharide-induced tumor necrosis factor-alpha factor homolog n=1 Tax=Austrofundulus limnaeus TaxID=52670 RepID=A0A2I4CHH3_AUSLI|nr:PREDICTED: lipopolysaccharide-induced tumor necrosis factor-alpha factor homolog [Austrofundulus limnaeus]
MASPDASAEMKHISVKRQQLHERRKILCIFQELRERAEFGQTEEAAATQLEIDQIDQRLKELEEMETELNRTYVNVLNASDIKGKQGISEPALPPDSNDYSNVCYIELPPSYPAPTVVLDIANLPPYSCKTQCPECKQFVITETSSSVSSVTWMSCIIAVLVGCVAGCCLIPFCSDKFKSINHHCPKCRTKIITTKRL